MDWPQYIYYAYLLFEQLLDQLFHLQ
jgi:hypothetical protein